MTESPLVLSLFPGIGLLDMAFEQEGFCVVRGPDLLWGGDVKRFHPPAQTFAGIIGGPPCQQFSQVNQAARMGLQTLAPNLIPEFERCISEAFPCWFQMENVVQAPLPSVAAVYGLKRVIWNNRWNGGVQNRVRSLVFGCRRRPHREFVIEGEALMASEKAGCFTANGTQWDADKGRSRGDRTFKSFAKGLRLQGLPADFLERAPFTIEGKVRVIGNGVPLPMGRAIAKAVRQAMGYPPSRNAVDPSAQPQESGSTRV